MHPPLLPAAFFTLPVLQQRSLISASAVKNVNSWSPRSVRTGRENDAQPKEESPSNSAFPPLEGR